MTDSPTIAVTGATGQLGRLVIAELRERAPSARIVGIVRNPDAAADLAARGVELRKADYEDAEALKAALSGVDRLVLISGSEVGRRLPQHRNIIEAAKSAGVKLVAYTSLLRADSSPLPLAPEHKETEALLKSSGLPHVLLRNGWYTENYTQGAGPAVEHGAVVGSARDGRIASATRADFAAAAAVVITSADDQAGKVYELAGDSAYTLGELAAEIARQSGKPVVYNDMPKEQYAGVLESVGVPAPFAAVLAECDAFAAEGALYDDSRTLSRLIGRPTTPLAETVKAALAG